MRPPPVSILGQPNPVHIPTFHLLEIHPNIIYPSTPRSPQWSLSLRFPHQDPIHPTLLTHSATCPTHLILLDFITRTILGEEYKSFEHCLQIYILPKISSLILYSHLNVGEPNRRFSCILSNQNIFVHCPLLQVWSVPCPSHPLLNHTNCEVQSSE